MKTGFLITGRLKSTRLPLKLLREVEGKPIFSHMIDRLKLARRVDQIIVCTSTNPQDDPLEEIAASENVFCFRGDEDDVVKRNADACLQFGLDYALSITADCPFSDPVYADKIVDAYLETGADFIRALDLPHGAYSYGVNPQALLKIMEIKDQTDSETWGRYFTDTDLFEVYDLPIPPSHRLPELRMTLDYPEDLEFFKAVFAALYKPGQVFTLDEILGFLEAHPEVVAINRDREADYLKRWTKQSFIKLKPRYTINRATIIGSGSMGLRHIQSLRSLGVTDIVALRSGDHPKESLPAELGVTETFSWQEVIQSNPDVAIISNPTSLHVRTAMDLLSHVKGIFIEKPLGTNSDRISELLEQIRSKRVVSFVGHNLQFHPAIKVVQDILQSDQIGEPLVFQVQVGQWIGDWHPGEDYTASYVASKELGGGVSLTLSHEIHLATQLFGPVEEVFCRLPESKKLKFDVDVISDLMCHHVNGATSQIHLDMLQRPAHRIGVISCERGWISYDLIGKTVVMQSHKQATPVEVWNGSDYDISQSYVDEMKSFLDVVREGRIRHENDAWAGARTLAVIEAAFQSAKSHCVSKVTTIA